MLLAVAAALGAYATAALTARAGLRRLLFPAPPGAGTCPDDARLWTLGARDGAVVHAIEVPRASDARARRGTVVYFHGNAQTAADVVPLARLLADQGLRVVALEYRGYGPSRSAGPASEVGLYADAEALLERLAGGGEPREPLAFWGTSLGAAVAVEMARRVPAAALVLVSPFTSARALCRRYAPVLPSRVIVRDAFDSLEKAPGLRVPTLVVHGEADRLVPPTMGRALADRIPGARFVGVPGAGHDIFATNGDDVVREALAHLAAHA